MKALQHNKIYFILYFSILALVLVWISMHTRFESFEILNSHHTALLDKIMPFITFGGTFFFSFFLFLFSSPRLIHTKWLYYILIGLMVMLFITVLKSYFDYPRPRSFPQLQAYISDYRFIGDLRMHSYPSGHSATIFYAITSYLLLNPSKKLLQVALLGLAILIAYSRIYLGQHFLEDVVSGSYLGVAIPTFMYCLYYKKLDEAYL